MTRSAIGRTPTTPGPLTPVMRPSRKTTSRVYSGTTRNGRNVPCILAGPLIAIPPCDSFGIRIAVHFRDRRDHQRQTLCRPDDDLRANRCLRRRVVTEGRRPALTLDAHRTRGLERLGDDGRLAEQGLGAAHHRDTLHPPGGSG